MPDAPKPSPRPPDGSSLEHTPTDFPVTAKYVNRKLSESEASRGRPVIPRKMTPYFFGGFTLCGAITTVSMTTEGIPKWMLIGAAVGTMFFSGMLGMSSGWRK